MNKAQKLISTSLCVVALILSVPLISCDKVQSILSGNTSNTAMQETFNTQTHTGYVSSWAVDDNFGDGRTIRRTLGFQDGLIIKFMYWGGRAPAIGEKIKLEYRYDTSVSGNTMVSIADAK